MRRMLDAKARCALLLLGMTAQPTTVYCQEAAPLTPGAHVRVQWIETSNRYRRDAGTLLELRADSLALAQREGERRIALARVMRIDVKVPRSRGRGSARGAAIGAVVGLGLGVVGGAYNTSMCRGEEFCGVGMIVGPVVGVLAGLPLGIVFGWNSPGHRWRQACRAPTCSTRSR
jgi:hypothetical protein